jgi:hypothetical protein
MLKALEVEQIARSQRMNLEALLARQIGLTENVEPFAG